jgi:DNA-binding response OmpR family regulator
VKKILIIEDEQAVADYVGMFLRDAGYAVERARDGEEARTAISGNPYDLVLLDLMLPDITGLELLPELKRHGPNTPVLIVSGLAADDERLVNCLRNGAAGSVPKASRAEELLAAVRRALRE